MENAQVFSIANSVAALSWVALAVAPARTWRIVRFAIPGVLAVAYIWFIVPGMRGGEGGFDSLVNVMKLFTREEAVLAGWIHYLAFDLFVGTWETEDALARRVSRFLLVPCLALTFMFGPAGLLMYYLVRQTGKGRPEPLTV
jgi:hypothetical protein